MSTARKIFKSVMCGKNIFTPEVIGYYKINEVSAIELSKGMSMTGKTMYGVCVVLNNEYNSNISDTFYSIGEVHDYIKSIKRQYK